MFEYLRARLQQGTRTSPFPQGPVEFPERFRGLPVLDRDVRGDDELPSELIVTTPDGDVFLDVGACLFTPEEATRTPEGMVTFTRDYRMAASAREALVSPTGGIELAQALDAKMRSLFGRSLRLRSVVAGSCAGCEAELVALSNVVFDAARFGIQFVASPRHADGMLVTGAVNRNMHDVLQRVYDAMPEPRLVIAVGACAINGGPFRGSAIVENGLPPSWKVDLYIPGCPPHPLTILDGLLRLLGRLPAGRVAAIRDAPCAQRSGDVRPIAPPQLPG